MYSSYTPQLPTDEKAAEMEGIHYFTALPFDNDEVELSSKQEQEIEEMDEVTNADDPYRIVMTEFDMGMDRIHSLVSLTRTANNTEKLAISC